MNKKSNVYYMILTSVFAAIIIVMTYVPYVGFIPYGIGLSFTLIHIPVLIGAFLLPKRYSWILGLFFGLGSFIRSFENVGPLDPAFQNPLTAIVPRVLFAVAAAWLFVLFKFLAKKIKNNEVVFFSIVTLVTVVGFYYGAVATTSVLSWKIEIIAPIALVLAVAFLSFYYAIIKQEKYAKNLLIPTVLLLGTIVHTILTLLAVVVFSYGFISQFFGNATEIINFILVTSVTNGLIEALLAVIIGTPIILTLQNSKYLSDGI